MIRRWSHVIELVNDFSQPFYYKKRFKFRIFRLNVRFRRFNLKKTKFKRKSLMRFKHRANWYLYFGILKTWSQDFKSIRKYLKYQYLNCVLMNNAIIFDPNYFKFKNEFYLYNFNGKISNISKKFYYYLHKVPLNSLKHINLTLSWFEDNFDASSNIVSLYSYYDFKFYPLQVNRKKKSSFFLNNFFFFLTLAKILELKKILNRFLLYSIFKR